jgi:four helix bundle protein
VTRINKLSDIEIYKKSLDLARKVYSLTRKPNLSKDFSLINQIRSAAISITANIAEGYGRRTRKDFAQFLSIALGSANEVFAYLDFISLEYQIDIRELKQEYDILAKKIHSFRSYLITHIP